MFDEHGIIWGPVLGLHEVASDPQADALGLFPEIEQPEVGRYRTVAIPMRFGQADVQPRGPSPALGAHTRDVLAECGLSPADIDTLAGQGVIGTG